MPLGAKNKYNCQTCGRGTVTIDRDEGVTPFMVLCRATLKCQGMAHSQFYCGAEDLTPTHEWRKPSIGERKKIDKATLEGHVYRGGLLLYEISTRKRCE